MVDNLRPTPRAPKGDNLRAYSDPFEAGVPNDGPANIPSARTLGTGAAQACAGSDSRLSNARTPTAHHTTHESGGADVIAVDHVNLANKGTNTHAQIDTFVASKSAASGLAPLDANSKVPTDNLGGAGADNTKFLRGDQTWAAPSSGSITYYKTALTADVAMASAGSWYDGPSIALTAGKWEIIGHLVINLGGGGSGDVGVRLYDGATVYDSSIMSQASGWVTLPLSTIVDLASDTTMKLSAVSYNQNNSYMDANYGPGNHACSMTAKYLGPH